MPRQERLHVHRLAGMRRLNGGKQQCDTLDIVLQMGGRRRAASKSGL
jgi:hypothetical protein